MKKVLVEAQLKGLIAGTIQVGPFYDVLEKELGKPKLKEISAELLTLVPKDKADKLGAVFKSKF